MGALRNRLKILKNKIKNKMKNPELRRAEESGERIERFKKFWMQ